LGAKDFSAGSIAAIKSSAGSRTSDSYLDLFSSNHARLLLAESSSRKEKVDLVNMDASF
jgi:hypothetical protein